MPALLIFLPTANSNAPTYISKTKANLQCLRADNVNPGSEKVAAAPSPTPLHGGSLSGGAIAGIVIGVLAGVALIGGAAFLFWRRRRRSRQAQALEPEQKGGDPESPVIAGKDAGEMNERTHVVEAEDTPVKELSPDSEVTKPGTEMKPAELSGANGVVEKDGAANVVAEKEAAEAPLPPAEMLGDVPKDR